VGAILAAEGLYPTAAFEAATHRLQKTKVAETNLAGFAAGWELVN